MIIKLNNKLMNDYIEVPFNLELAKKITNNEVGGIIVTRDGRSTRIICFDAKRNDSIIALINDSDESEQIYSYPSDGRLFTTHKSNGDLRLEILKPNGFAENNAHPKSKDYLKKFFGIEQEKDFKPFDKVLVRNNDKSAWSANFFSHKIEENGCVRYFCCGHSYDYCIPYNEGTSHLCSTKLYYE